MGDLYVTHSQRFCSLKGSVSVTQLYMVQFIIKEKNCFADKSAIKFDTKLNKLFIFQIDCLSYHLSQLFFQFMCFKKPNTSNN